MNLIVHCYKELDSVTVKDRAYEFIYTYSTKYCVFTTNIATTGIKENRQIVCPYCSDTFQVNIRGRKELLWIQISFLAALIFSLYVSIMFFALAVENESNGLWTLAIISIFGCVLAGVIAFNIKQYEFENHYRIKNNKKIKNKDYNVTFLKHKLVEENYKYEFIQLYKYMKIVYFLSISAYIFEFSKVVIAKENNFKVVLLYLFFISLIGLPIYFFINYLYDKKNSAIHKLK